MYTFLKSGEKAMPFGNEPSASSLATMSIRPPGSTRYTLADNSRLIRPEPAGCPALAFKRPCGLLGPPAASTMPSYNDPPYGGSVNQMLPS